MQGNTATVPFTLNVDAFEAWLADKHGNEIVGRCGDPHKCPVASFIRSQVGAFDLVEVFSFDVRWAPAGDETGAVTIFTPEILGAFVEAIDRLPHPIGEQPKVRAATARRVLAEVRSTHQDEERA